MYNSDFLKDFCSDAKPIYSVAFWLDLDATLEVFWCSTKIKNMDRVFKMGNFLNEPKMAQNDPKKQ